MSKKSWNLDRRTFLFGAGVACAMPYLEAMGTASNEAPKRLCYIYFPNGCCLPNANDKDEKKNDELKHLRWFPQATGKNYKATQALEPLQSFRDDISVLGGLSHPRSRELLGHISGDTFLTGGDLRGSYENNISIDQYAAEHLAKDTRYPSFSFSGDGGVGFPSRATTLSFNHTGQAVPSEHRHRLIFERYFSQKGSMELRQKKLAEGKRLVDTILDSSRHLKRQLGQKDQRTMDQYLATLSDVEKQIEKNEVWLKTPLKKVEGSSFNLDVDPKEGCENYVKAMLNIMALGFHMDLTRVMSFQISREDGMGFGENYPKHALGLKKGHHGLSHTKDLDGYRGWSKMDTWMSQHLAHLLKEMKSRNDEHGNLLDNTQILFGSSQSHTHNATNAPLILAGGKNMGLKHGSYETFPEKVPMSNLFVSMGQAAGIPCKSFSDSTGPLPGQIFPQSLTI
jgi:hypothetical protein